MFLSLLWLVFFFWGGGAHLLKCLRFGNSNWAMKIWENLEEMGNNNVWLVDT